MQHLTNELAEALQRILERDAGGIWFFRKLRAYEDLAKKHARALIRLKELGDKDHQTPLMEAQALCDKERSLEFFYLLGYDQGGRPADKRRQPLHVTVEQLKAWSTGVEDGEFDQRQPWHQDRDYRRAAAVNSFKIRQAKKAA